LIPQGDGKLPAQSLEHSLLMLLPKMRNDFGVAVLHQSMPARFQFSTLLKVVKQFAIEDHDDASVLIGHRLLAIRKANNAQPARRQRNARLKKETLLVRATMENGTRHPPHGFIGHGSFPSEINNACNSTHVRVVSSLPYAKP
jgi:hypothetical protein